MVNQRSDSWSISSFKIIHPEEEILNNEQPKTLEGCDIPQCFEDEASHTSPEVFVLRIKDGRAWSDCAVMSPDNKVLADVSRIFSQSVENHSIFKKRILRPPTYIDGNVATLAVFGGDHNYFHWMFDALPRIGLLAEDGIKISDIDYFYVNSCHLPFQKETLEVLGIPSSKLIECMKITHIKAQQLIVPSLPIKHTGNTGHIPGWVCNFYEKNFSKLKVKRSYSKRIYINRLDASHRKILNEENVIYVLEKMGFQSLSLSELAFSEQVSIFAFADFIIAPHGAGLSNLIFCSPQTKLIEIFHPSYVNPCYWSLCNRLSLKYFFLLGKLSETSNSNSYASYMKDFLVDIPQLVQVTELMFSS